MEQPAVAFGPERGLAGSEEEVVKIQATSLS